MSAIDPKRTSASPLGSVGVGYNAASHFLRVNNPLRRQAYNLFSDRLDHRVIGIMEVQNRARALERGNHTRDGFRVESGSRNKFSDRH
jgi:hypothetical protein